MLLFDENVNVCADNVVICGESGQQVAENLESKEANYICFYESKASWKIQLWGLEVVKVDEFEYVTSTSQSHRQYTIEVKKRLHAEGMDGGIWMSGVVCG